MKRVARLALLAYPRSFRRDFGDQYLQLVDDLRDHRGHGRSRVLARLLTDTLLTAPAMRWEHLMHSGKIVLPVIAAVVAAFAVLIGAPLVALPLVALLGALVIAAHRHGQPIATEAADWGRRWYAWLITAAVLAMVGLAALLTNDNGDLSTVAWATWLLSWLAAGIVGVVGAGLGAMHLRRHRRT